MLPDIRVVVTAIATTVLILVGIGLMASIRLTHQSVSAQSDPPVTSRMTWRQPEPVLPDAILSGHAPWRPEKVVGLAHETMDMTTLSSEERNLAEKVMTSVPAPRYAAASLDPAETPQLAARVAEDQGVAHPSSRNDPTTTASVGDPKIPAKKASSAPATTKLPPAAAKAQAQAAKAKRARRTARAKANDKNGLETLFSFDQMQ
jgi:hypothetical protein